MLSQGLRINRRRRTSLHVHDDDLLRIDAHGDHLVDRVLALVGVIGERFDVKVLAVLRRLLLDPRVHHGLTVASVRVLQ